jgi:F-type H+-transporting ATPase subunit delta
MASSNAGPKRQSFDIKVEVLARIYAKALLGAALEAGVADQVVADLAEIVHDLFNGHPELEGQMLDLLHANARVPADEKDKVLDKMFGGKVHPLLLNFLKVVTRHQRGIYLRAIESELVKLFEESRGRVRVEVRTAVRLEDEGLIEAIRTGVLKRFGEPQLIKVMDPALIGGIVIRVGDTVFDGSLATELKRIREQMLHRSVHEIQSRRDRFGSAEGN